MRKFKKIDCWLSAAMIFGFCIYSICFEAAAVLAGYFIVGAWHCISMLTHECKGWFTERKSARRTYHQIIFVLFLLAIAGFFLPEIFGFLACTLFFAAPFMAIFYTSLCFHERFNKMQRPMALLK